MKVIVYADTLDDARDCAEKWFPGKQGGTYLIAGNDDINSVRGLTASEIHMTEDQYHQNWLGHMALQAIRPAVSAAKDPKIVLHLR